MDKCHEIDQKMTKIYFREYTVDSCKSAQICCPLVYSRNIFALQKLIHNINHFGFGGQDHKKKNYETEKKLIAFLFCPWSNSLSNFMICIYKNSQKIIQNTEKNKCSAIFCVVIMREINLNVTNLS